MCTAVCPKHRNSHRFSVEFSTSSFHSLRENIVTKCDVTMKYLEYLGLLEFFPNSRVLYFGRKLLRKFTSLARAKVNSIHKTTLHSDIYKLSWKPISSFWGCFIGSNSKWTIKYISVTLININSTWNDWYCVNFNIRPIC